MLFTSNIEGFKGESTVNSTWIDCLGLDIWSTRAPQGNLEAGIGVWPSLPKPLGWTWPHKAHRLAPIPNTGERLPSRSRSKPCKQSDLKKQDHTTKRKPHYNLNQSKHSNIPDTKCLLTNNLSVSQSEKSWKALDQIQHNELIKTCRRIVEDKKTRRNSIKHDQYKTCTPLARIAQHIQSIYPSCQLDRCVRPGAMNCMTMITRGPISLDNVKEVVLNNLPKGGSFSTRLYTLLSLQWPFPLHVELIWSPCGNLMWCGTTILVVTW